MKGPRLRPISGLLVTFIILLALIVGAGIGGIALVDIVRAYVGGEALYSKGQKGAVISLYRYARSRDPEAYDAYERMIRVPLGDRKARQVLEDPAQPISESYQPFMDGGNHPDDVQAMAWLFRTFGTTEIFSPPIETWRQADAQIVALDKAARTLRQTIQNTPVDEAGVAQLLAEIDGIDQELTRLESRFSEQMRYAARRVADLLYIGLSGVGGSLALLAFIFAMRTQKRIDATEHALRQAKDAAQHASQAKTNFLANMSHELRTPLNAIIGFADIMASKLFGPLDERYVVYARDIQKSGDHLLGLITDILDLARIEAGQIALEEEPMNVFEAVETCCSFLDHKANEMGVSVVNKVPDDGTELFVDAKRVRQVLLNVIGNAIKFSPPGTSVHVRMEHASDGICLQIIDKGAGIPAEQIERVFEPFVQASSGLARSHEGVGLGLAMAKRFVELHDGTISLTSEVGQGTTVTVRFPVKSVLPAQAASASAAVT